MATTDTSIPLSTLLHMLTIKLSSSNYLLWRNQVLPLLSYQNLHGHIDGTNVKPTPTITTDNTSSPNPAFSTWKEADQRALIILQATH